MYNLNKTGYRKYILVLYNSKTNNKVAKLC